MQVVSLTRGIAIGYAWNRLAVANQWMKIFKNRSTFAKVINKHQVTYFFETQCILEPLANSETLLLLNNLHYSCTI